MASSPISSAAQWAEGAGKAVAAIRGRKGRESLTGRVVLEPDRVVALR